MVSLILISQNLNESSTRCKGKASLDHPAATSHLTLFPDDAYTYAINTR